MGVLIRTATSPNLEDDKVLDDLVRTEGWLTLMTFAREVARKFACHDAYVFCVDRVFSQRNHHLQAHRRLRVAMYRWIQTYLQKCLTRSRKTAELPQGQVVVSAVTSAFAHTAPSRTPTGATIARFAGCHYKGVAGVRGQ